MAFAAWCYQIFEEGTLSYHVQDCVDAEMNNPYESESIEHCLFFKNWIDAVQWHLEDVIRNPDIEPVTALNIKRRIDLLNQRRTDLVECLDRYFLNKYSQVKIQADATLNTESPAWAIDRLSILCLKIYHMQQEVQRKGVDRMHVKTCEEKLHVLLEQKRDLIEAIDQLFADIEAGKKCMKVYKQMKMYNDPSLNPILYNRREQRL